MGGGGGGGHISITVQSRHNAFLESIGMDRVLSESCYKGTILQKKYRKMTIKWSFSYISFVKFHGKKNWELQHDRNISKSML